MQTEYALLYAEINTFSLILIAVVLRKTMGLSKMVAQRNFAMSIIAEMVFFISDTVFVLINEGMINLGSFTGAAKLLCKELYFFSTVLMCFFWFLYFEYLRDSELVKTPFKIRLASTIMWILTVLLIANLFGGFLFYVDKSGDYHRGPLFILTYVFSYIYVIVAFSHTLITWFKKSDAANRKLLLLLLLFPIAPGGAGILQFIYPRYPIACGVLALATLLLYLNWIDQLISLDPLTGLNNRNQMMHYYQQWSKNRSDGSAVYLLMIDANKFKSINDTYGHVQGDKALKNIADALRLGCRELPKRANISRYGGDEFAIMFESDGREECEKLKTRIKEKLAEINERTKVPFELTVSIGIASSSGSLSLKQLIDDADEDMYEEKKNAGGR
ncbi:MAG: diguanylate cyclase [Lachnospiraceae bacterium]|nr:diguanylate cyclase [Lachnospiraceae bacterium]